MSTFRSEFPKDKMNTTSDRFFFPVWKEWMTYPVGYQVARVNPNPLSRDSDYLVNVPAYTYEVTRIVENDNGPGDGVVEKSDSLPAGTILIWDSDTATWSNVPTELSGLINTTQNFSVLPKIDSPRNDTIFNSPLDSSRWFEFFSYYRFNTATGLPNSGSFIGAVNDPDGACGFGPATLYVEGNLIVEIGTGALSESTNWRITGGMTYSDGTAVTVNEIRDNDGTTVLSTNASFHTAEFKPKARLADGYQMAVQGGVSEDVYWDSDNYNFTNISPYFFGAVSAEFVTGNAGDFFFIRNTEIVGTSFEASPVYQVEQERTEYPAIKVVKKKKRSVSYDLSMYDFSTIDGSAIADNPNLVSNLYDGAYDANFLFKDGVEIARWIDYGGINGDSFGISKYHPDGWERDGFGGVQVTLDTGINSRSFAIVSALTTDSDYLGGSSSTDSEVTELVTVEVPERDIVIKSDDTTISFWTSIKETNKGFDPLDSDNSEYWRLFFDKTYESNIMELEGTLTHFQNFLPYTLDSEAIKELRDSDDYIEIEVSKLDSDAKALRIEHEHDVNKFDSELNYLFKSLDSDLPILSNIESDLLIHIENKKTEVTNTDSDSDLRVALRQKIINTIDSDSDIIQQILNYPKQVFTQEDLDKIDSEFWNLTFTEYQNYWDSDIYVLLDTDALFPKSLIDTEFMTNFESDSRFYVDVILDENLNENGIFDWPPAQNTLGGLSLGLGSIEYTGWWEENFGTATSGRGHYIFDSEEDSKMIGKAEILAVSKSGVVNYRTYYFHGYGDVTLDEWTRFSSTGSGIITVSGSERGIDIGFAQNQMDMIMLRIEKRNIIGTK